jgi:hypothetical protein
LSGEAIKNVCSVIKRSVLTVDCGLIEQEWGMYCESDKSSDEYLSLLEGVMEGRTEEFNCET